MTLNVAGTAVVSLLLSAAAAAAQPVGPAAAGYDERIVDACLSQHWGGQNARESCIGIASRACMPQGEGDAALAVGCLDAERAQWQARLTETLEQLRAQVAPAEPDAAPVEAPADAAAPAQAAPDAAAALEAMQSAWQAWRDAACGFDAARYPGTPVAEVGQAECLMRLTARQVFDLQSRLDGGA